MATLPNSEELWTVREYLRTSWSPDREFVDGRIEERNLGEKEHSIIQRYLTVLFAIKREEWGVEVFPELRTQTEPQIPRSRCAGGAGGRELRSLRDAPAADRHRNSFAGRFPALMREKAAEYRGFGIENIWVIDPEPRIAYRYTSAGLEEVRTGSFPCRKRRSGGPERVVRGAGPNLTLQ